MSEIILEYDGREFTLPHGDLIPPPNSEELAGLTESIRQHGVLHQIYHDKDDVVISGSTRLVIAKSLGIPLAELPMRELHTEDAEMLAIQLNTTGRKWPRERLVMLAHRLRRMEWSIRRIVEATGTSIGTIHRFLEEPDPDAGFSGVPTGTPETVVGSDGKTYPAGKPKPVGGSDDRDAVPVEDLVPEGRDDVPSTEPTDGEPVPRPKPEPNGPPTEKELKKQFDRAFGVAQRLAAALSKYQQCKREWLTIYNTTMGINL